MDDGDRCEGGDNEARKRPAAIHRLAYSGVRIADLSLPAQVRVVEVGPRDGLQNEARAVPTEEKIRFIHLLAASGLSVVEATSFVSPRLVPQLADAEAVMRGLERRPGVRYPALVPNRRGLERALAVGAQEIAVVTSASETFNQRNLGRSIGESLAEMARLVPEAHLAGLWVRAYVSTAFACPYEGPVAPSAVLPVVERLREIGVAEISLGDTIGVATPRQVAELLEALLGAGVPRAQLGLHLHDTRGTALANVLAGLEYGISIFDSSAGGLGGCPFAPGASGNLATEDLCYMLQGMGISTGVDAEAVAAAARLICAQLGRPPASHAAQACAAPGAAISR